MTRLPSLGALVTASRPISWVNTAFPFAAAYLMATREVDTTLVVGTLFFLVPYNLLMYGVNDVFDIDSDELNPRKGGAEGARTDRATARGLLLLSLAVPLPFVLWLLTRGGPVAGLVLLLVLAAVLLYSLPVARFKERPLVDSMTSSAHFVGPAVYGLVLSGVAAPAGVWVVLAAFFVWGLASHAFGAVQDVVSDRAAGIGSVATVIGAAPTVRLAAGLYLLSGLLLLLGPWPAPLAALLVIPYVLVVLRHRAVTDATAAEAHLGWRRFLVLNYVVGFAVTQLLIISTRTP